MVISGVIAPILLGLFSLLFMVFFKKASNIFVKITMLYFFTAAFTSYGIEVVVGNSAHLFVSILLMYFIMKILSRLQDRLSARTTN